MATMVVGAVVATGIGFMLDIAMRKPTCPKCVHCQEEARIEELAEDKKRREELASLHRRGHRSDFGDINGQCPVCKESGRVPPPSGSSNDEEGE